MACAVTGSFFHALGTARHMFLYEEFSPLFGDLGGLLISFCASVCLFQKEVTDKSGFDGNMVNGLFSLGSK